MNTIITAVLLMRGTIKNLINIAIEEHSNYFACSLPSTINRNDINATLKCLIGSQYDRELPVECSHMFKF